MTSAAHQLEIDDAAPSARRNQAEGNGAKLVHVVTLHTETGAPLEVVEVVRTADGVRSYWFGDVIGGRWGTCTRCGGKAIAARRMMSGRIVLACVSTECGAQLKVPTT